MKTKQQRDWLSNTLTLMAFERAHHFVALVQAQPPGPSPGNADEVRGTVVDRHLGTLTVESQLAILGLPEALIGLRILAGVDVHQSLAIAEELANYARQGSSGDREIDDAWLLEAIDIIRRSWGQPPLRMYTPATAFYKAVLYFSGITTSLKLKDVHGVVYPDLNTLDAIFREIDSVCHQVGGSAILTWRYTRRSEDRKLPYDMLANYGAKHLRRLQNSNANALTRLETLVTQFHCLMRFDQPANMGALWAEPAFIVEEIARNILATRLCDVRHWRPSADLALADFLIRRHGAVVGWDVAKTMFEKTPGTDVSHIDIPSDWIHAKPDPNSGYGDSLRSALGGNLNSRPVVEKLGRRLVAPRTTVTDYTGEVQRRLSLSPHVLATDFEHFLREKLSRLGPVVHGDYFRVGQKTKLGDIDALLPTSDGSAIIVFECKAMAELPLEWSGGYHATLEYLRRVFLKSQEQLLRLEKHLQKEGTLEVFQDGQRKPLTLAGARVFRVSTSMRTFGALHRPGYSGAILSHFCNVKMATEPSPRLGVSLTNHQAEIQQHLKDLGPLGMNTRLRETLFIDLSWMDALIASSDSADNLAERLDKSLERAFLISRVIPTEPDLP